MQHNKMSCSVPYLCMQDDLDCQNEYDEEVMTDNMKSTKQPLHVGRKPTKRQRIEDTENALLEKAITVMQQSSLHLEETSDSAELFGRSVAAELRMLNPQSQRWAKVQMQNILYSAALSETSPTFPQPGPSFRQPSTDPLYQHQSLYQQNQGPAHSHHASPHTPSSSQTPSISALELKRIV